MSEDIGRLQRQVGNLKRALKEERTKWADVKRSLGVESASEALERVQTMSEAIENDWPEIMRELEELREGTLNPDEKDQLIADLYAEQDKRQHMDVFGSLAEEMGLDPSDVPDLWQLQGYQAEGEPDEGSIRAFLEKAREERPRYFAPLDDTQAEAEGEMANHAPAGVTLPNSRGFRQRPGSSPAAKAEPSPKSTRGPLKGPGGGRGGYSGEPGKFVVRRSEMMNDPGWLTKNGEKYREAYSSGTLDFRENE